MNSHETIKEDAKLKFRKDTEDEYRKFMILMRGTGFANLTLSIMIYNALTALTMSVPHAYLYPLIVTNIIIINNIVTSLAPILLKRELILAKRF